MRALAALLIGTLLSGCVSASGATSEPQRPADYAFVPVVPSRMGGAVAPSTVGPDSAGRDRDEPMAQLALADDLLLVPDLQRDAVDGRPVPVPSPRLIVVPRSPEPASHRARGIASWYFDGPGLYAAAGSALRRGDWRGRTVLVSFGSRSVRVRLTDSCQCYGSRLIDLSRDAFSRLAPLSRGLLEVTVSWK